MVHGAWHTGACFERLRAPLEKAGHSLIAPDLPGVGGDSRALARASLRRWADFIVETAAGLASPVILCGHSRGGIVVSQAAELAPEAFAALVYVSGALIPNGRSMYDVLGANMESGPFGKALIPVADGLGLNLAPEAAISYFYNLCTPEDQAACARQLAVEPVRPMGTKLTLTPSRFGSVPRHYVECVHDRTFSLELQRMMQQELPCESVSALESDHSPFVSEPALLVATLDGIAKGVSI